MSILVISEFLFLLCDRHSNLDSLANLASFFVQPEGMLGLLGNTIDFSHEVVDELVGQRIQLDLGHHVDHIRNSAFAVLDVQLERLAVLLALFVVLSSMTPLRLAFKVSRNLLVFIDVLLINLINDL